MNKLSFSEGGQPISLDDLEFLQSAIDQSLQFLTERLPNGIYFKIEEKSGDKEGDPRKLIWDDGVAIIGGKTAFMRKGELPLSQERDKYCVHRIQRHVAEKSFEDSSTHATQLLEEAEIIPLNSLAPNEPHLLLSVVTKPSLIAITKEGTARVYHHGTMLGLLYAHYISHGFYLIRGEFKFDYSMISEPESCIIKVPQGQEKWFNGGGFLSGDNIPLGTSIHISNGRYLVSGEKDESKYPQGSTKVTVSYLTYHLL